MGAGAESAAHLLFEHGLVRVFGSPLGSIYSSRLACD